MSAKSIRPLHNPDRLKQRWQALNKRIKQVALNQVSYKVSGEYDELALLNMCYTLFHIPDSSTEPQPVDIQDDAAQALPLFVWERNCEHLEAQSENIESLKTNLLEFSELAFAKLFEAFFPNHAANVQTPSQRMASTNKLLQRVRKENASIYSADRVLNVFLQQSTLDYLRIRQAYELRFGSQELTEDTKQADISYSMADVLANEAIKKAIGSEIGAGPFPDLSGNDAIVVTYPTNHVNIRILPYSSNTMLIGFPATAFANYKYDKISKQVDIALSTAFLALSHEAGHLVYRHGRISKRAAKQEMQSSFAENEDSFYISDYLNRFMANQHKPNPTGSLAALFDKRLSAWQEELFADVFGCFIDGPVCVVGFQEMMESEQAYHWNETDAEHPPSDIRPLIQTKILRIITEKIPEWQALGIAYIAEKLDERWKSQFGEVLPNDALLRYLRLNDLLHFMVDTLIALGIQPYAPPKVYDFEAQLKSCAENEKSGEDVANLLFVHYCKIAFKNFLISKEGKSQNDQPTWLENKLNQLVSTDAFYEEIILGGWGDESGGGGNHPGRG